mgnify:CR=1 FL=1
MLSLVLPSMLVSSFARAETDCGAVVKAVVEARAKIAEADAGKKLQKYVVVKPKGWLPNRGPVTYFYDTARKMIQRWNKHFHPVGSLDTSHRHLASSKVALWSDFVKQGFLDIGDDGVPTSPTQLDFLRKFFGESSRTTFKKEQVEQIRATKDFIEKSKALIEYRPDGGNAVADDVVETIAKIKAFSNDQRTIMTELSSVLYEMESIRSLFGEYKVPEILGDVPGINRMAVFSEFPREGVVNEIPKFGDRAAFSATYANAEDAAVRLKALRDKVEDLKGKSKQRSLDQVIYFKIVETYHTMHHRELQAMQLKFGKEIQLPKVWLDVMGQIASVFEGGVFGGKWAKDYAPNSAATGAVKKVQFTAELMAWLKNRMQVLKDEKTQSWIKNTQEWMEAAIKAKDQTFDQLGLRALKEDADVVQNWRWTRIGRASLGFLGIVGGGGGLKAVIDHLTQEAPEIAKMRVKREECISAEHEEDAELPCREYLQLKFPGKTLAANHGLLDITKNGKFVDKEVQAEVQLLVQDRMRRFKERQAVEGASLAWTEEMGKSDPSSLGFRNDLQKGPTLTPAEIAEKKTRSQKFFEVMLGVPPTAALQEAYKHDSREADPAKKKLAPLYAELVKSFVKVQPEGMWNRFMAKFKKGEENSPFERTFLRFNHTIAMSNPEALQHTLEILFAQLEREKLIASMIEERLAPNANLEQIEENENLNRDRLSSIDRLIDSRIRLLQVIPAAMDMSTPGRYNTKLGLASDLSDILQIRSGQLDGELENARSKNENDRAEAELRNRVELSREQPMGDDNAAAGEGRRDEGDVPN